MSHDKMNPNLMWPICHDVINSLALCIGNESKALCKPCTRVTWDNAIYNLPKLRKMRFYHFLIL